MSTVDLPTPGVGPLARVAPKPIKFVLNWGRRYSLWVFNFGLACCAIEFIATSMSRHDFIRLGVIPFAPGPRQADLMVVSGTVTDKMAPAVRRLYEQMPEPKYVISFGACSNCGGPYWDSYCVTKGVDQIIPVDVYVPGCPPRPEALLHGIVHLQEKIAGESLDDRYGGGGEPVAPPPPPRPLSATVLRRPLQPPPTTPDDDAAASDTSTQPVEPPADSKAPQPEAPEPAQPAKPTEKRWVQSEDVSPTAVTQPVEGGATLPLSSADERAGAAGPSAEERPSRSVDVGADEVTRPVGPVGGRAAAESSGGTRPLPRGEAGSGGAALPLSSADESVGVAGAGVEERLSRSVDVGADEVTRPVGPVGGRAAAESSGGTRPLPRGEAGSGDVTLPLSSADESVGAAGAGVEGRSSRSADAGPSEVTQPVEPRDERADGASASAEVQQSGSGGAAPTETTQPAEAAEPSVEKRSVQSEDVSPTAVTQPVEPVDVGGLAGAGDETRPLPSGEEGPSEAARSAESAESRAGAAEPGAEKRSSRSEGVSPTAVTQPVEPVDERGARADDETRPLPSGEAGSGDVTLPLNSAGERAEAAEPSVELPSGEVNPTAVTQPVEPVEGTAPDEPSADARKRAGRRRRRGRDGEHDPSIIPGLADDGDDEGGRSGR
ncbi:NADH-quinone oxidoreductase subunit NuoB [Actinomadura keratinilytica]|uniref:NADH-quinone oxidoreductase subunit B n=1 Tax=Actinomadura keratinilytica TaxID=547461 RepID=A0ABP7Z841_9ACTN